MTSRESQLVKRLIVLVVLASLFPIGALTFRYILAPEVLGEALPTSTPFFYTLVPVAPTVEPTATTPPTPRLIVVPNGWNEFALSEESFAIALPPQWKRLPVNSEELGAALETIRASNPELATVLDTGGRQLVENGVKFWAVDLDPESLKLKFATNLTITHQTLANPVSFDAYVLVNLDQIDRLSTRHGAVNHAHLELANLPAERVNYQLLFQGSDGGTTISAITQYLVVNGSEAYVLTYATRLEELERYAPVFEQSAATFRILGQ